jgi:hypothetical protein
MMAKEDGASAEAMWLPVIGRTLAYLCMREAEKEKKFANLLDRVDFLEALGLPGADGGEHQGVSR